VPIDTVFLDAGGVLVFPNWQRVAAALGRHGVAIGGADLARVEWLAKHEVDTGAAGELDVVRGWLVFGRVFARAGVGDAAAIDAALGELQDYHARHNLWEIAPPEVIPALQRLRAQGRKLVVVSNANGRMRDALGRAGIAPHVDVVIDSFEEGVEKPNRRIFEIALARAGARAESTLHVGDLFHTDVVGARGAGLRAMLLDMADLYGDHDCERVVSLAALADLLERDDG
jgi:HAD superfamily hydrolase (TIGR01549 family)